jgi:glycosyltransferase involved in cell wall biosynthesis
MNRKGGRPVPIIFVIGTLDRGGTEGQVVELVIRLDRRRFAPLVCCLSTGGALEEPLALAGIPIKVIGFRGLRVFRHPLQVMGQMIRLVWFVRRSRPLIVHGFLFWAYILGSYAAWVARVPIIIASRRGLGNFKARKRHYLWLERVANRQADCLVANSRAVQQDVVTQEGVPSERIRVIYNGIEVGPYLAAADPTLRESLGIPEGALVVTVVANLIHYKGHRVFLQACRQILDVLPGVQILLIGEGPCRGDLEQLTRRLRLEGSIRFLGSRSNVPALLALADVSVLPSLEEGFPNAVLEAMAAGKPVVASLVGGIPEAVVHGTTGLLVPPGDPAALAEAILALLEDPVRAEAMGRAGRERVASRFGMDRMVRETERLYEELLRGVQL